MNGIDAAALGEWIKIFFYLTGAVVAVVVGVSSMRRKPNIDVDLSSVTSRLARVEADVRDKQNIDLCGQSHETLNSMLGDIKERHAIFEEKISRQIDGVHTRITDVFGELKKIEGKMES
jgi:hypothetical protein